MVFKYVGNKVEKQLKNPNATVCTEGELKKQGTQAKKQLKTPTVTACYSRRSINKVVRIPKSSRFPKKEKSVDSLDPKGGKGACKHLATGIMT